MVKHYLFLSIRHLLRHKVFTTITLLGLIIGITSAILLALFIVDEFSFDRFHDKANRIYRLTQTQQEGDGLLQLPYANPSTAPALKAQFPTIQQVAQLGISAPILLGNQDVHLIPKGNETYFATPSVFDIFTFPLVVGEQANSLTEPYSIVLTESLARRFFGNTDPMGQVLDFQVYGREMQGLKITGILKEVPANSHLQFECLVSFATLENINRNNPKWETQNVLTYLLLNEEKTASQLEHQFPDFLNNQMGKEKAANHQFELQALTDIHLHSSHFDSDRAKRGDYQLLLVLLAIAIGIISIASINFINLTTARARVRMKEIGVRKTMGAKRLQLIGQFLGETVFFTLFAMGLSLLVVQWVLPGFNDFIGKDLGIADVTSWSMLIGFAGLLGLISGAYPALYLSGFQPVEVLKGRLDLNANRTSFRKVLVVTQFAIAILLLIATGIVGQQLRFIQQKDLGYQKEQVLQTVIPSNRQTGNEMFQQELLAHPNILQVGRAVVRPLYDMKTNFSDKPTFAEVAGEMKTRDVLLRKIEVGHNFTEAFSMRLIAGRSFSEGIASDEKEAFILNESAVKVLGWTNPSEALAKRLNYDDREGAVIGVLEDFHFEGLHQPILPFVMIYNKFSPMVFIKIEPNNIAGTISHLQQSWEKYSTSKEPFQYTFMEDYFAAHYEAENRLQTILFSFALLAIFITCIGVLGLTAYTVEQRKKEIGIRKILGASVAQLMRLLSKEMLALFLLAIIIAWPLAGYFGQQWLQNFAYHQTLGISGFVGATLVVCTITLATVGILSMKAALGNPVQSLRSE